MTEITLTLDRKLLAAVALFAGRQDVRYYLNGVLAECHLGVLRMVATDGHRAICWKVGEIDAPDFEVILPIDFVNKCGKVRAQSIDIVIADTGSTCQQAGAIATAIDAKYPDWRRVLNVPPLPPAAAVFNPEYLMDMQRASVLAGRGKYGWKVYPRGKDVAPFFITESLVGAVMPMKFEDDFSPVLHRDVVGI